MIKRAACLLAVLTTLSFARADIMMPIADNFYDKMGRGIANVVFSPAEILESQWTLLQVEGGTVGFCKGFLVQGPSRMVQDMGLGIFDIITSPFPLHPGVSYQTFKQPPYDSMVVRDYPPADLEYWY